MNCPLMQKEYLTTPLTRPALKSEKTIEQDIHKFSHIPCMTDREFHGNVSGVAMEFKLQAWRTLQKIKTRYYKSPPEAASFYELPQKAVSIDVSGVSPVFTRAMPKNLLEISQYVANLWGMSVKKDAAVPGALCR